jgi:glycosyltransferase involved in cell wall biosynthesis
MNVALYLKHFPAAGSPLLGGTAIAVHGLASGLAANGAAVTVLCEGPQRRSTWSEAGYAIECFPNPAPYCSFRLAPELKRYVGERLTPSRSVCLVNGMFHPAAYAMGRLLCARGIPYVAVPHDPYERSVFRRNRHLKWPYWFLFERRLLKHAAAIQVLDGRHAECLRRLGLEVPVIEAPNGIDPAAVPLCSSLQWRGREAQPMALVFLGRLDAYHKGLDLLLAAVAQLVPELDLRLTLQGPDWGDRPTLTRQAQSLAIADRVSFREPDYRRPAPELIAAHDVFCLPSRFEGFGLAALEAMLAARVLLVSEGAGIASHVRTAGCGLAVPPTVAGIKAGLRALAKRRAEWKDMGLSGRRYALARFQWKAIAADALARYARLLA